MLGIDALIQLSQNRHSKYPTPMLMLLSGRKFQLPVEVARFMSDIHYSSFSLDPQCSSLADKIEIPDEFGIILAQKPLKQAELASLFVANAQRLLETKNCYEVVLGENDASSGGSTSTSSGEESASSQSFSCLVNQHGARVFEQESISMTETCTSIEFLQSSE